MLVPRSCSSLSAKPSLSLSRSLLPARLLPNARLFACVAITVVLLRWTPALGKAMPLNCWRGDISGLNDGGSVVVVVVVSGPGGGFVVWLVAANEWGILLNGWNTIIPSASSVIGKYSRVRNRCTNPPMILTAMMASMPNNMFWMALLSVPNIFPIINNGLLTNFCRARPVRAYAKNVVLMLVCTLPARSLAGMVSWSAIVSGKPSLSRVN